VHVPASQYQGLHTPASVQQIFHHLPVNSKHYSTQLCLRLGILASEKSAYLTSMQAPNLHQKGCPFPGQQVPNFLTQINQSVGGIQLLYKANILNKPIGYRKQLSSLDNKCNQILETNTAKMDIHKYTHKQYKLSN